MPQNTISVMKHTSTVDVAHEKTGTTLIEPFTVSFFWRVRVIDEVSDLPPIMISHITSLMATKMAEEEVRKQIKTNAEVEEKIRDNPWFIRIINVNDKTIQEKDAEGLKEVNLNDFFLNDPMFKRAAP